MKKFVGAAIVFAILQPASLIFGMTEDFNLWPFVAPVTIDRGDMGKPQALIKVSLPPEVFDNSSADFADLRVRASGGEALPYILQNPAELPQTKTEKSPARLLNRAYVKGKMSSAVADFGEGLIKNRVYIRTAGAVFHRRVGIEGSDDGKSWSFLRENSYIFRIRDDRAPGGIYDKNTVTFPDNKQHYLRVSVFNDSDDKGKVIINSVNAWREREPAYSEGSPVPADAVMTQWTEKKNGKRSNLTLDLGYKNMPLHSLKLNFNDANFFRRVEVYGRNAKESLRQVVAAENGEKAEKTVRQPWRKVQSAFIYRYTTGDDKDEKIVISLKGAAYRFLQVRVDNQDDSPLTFDSAQVFREPRFVLFQGSGNGSYSLYFGNEKAARPVYPLAHFLDDMGKDGALAGRLGATRPNAEFGGGAISASLRHHYRYAFWASLAVALGVLSLLLYRFVKNA